MLVILPTSLKSSTSKSPWESDKALIKLREGLVLGWYRDTLGKVTGGYGHLQKPGEEKIVITQAIADRWLDQDILSARQAAIRQSDFLPFMTKHLQDVLVSVNFQLGILWYQKFKKTWALMQEGKFADAATEAANSSWFKQTPARVKDFQVALREAQCLYIS